MKAIEQGTILGDDSAPVGTGGGPVAEVAGSRLAYEAPRCERLGDWTALTLQQSVILFP
jgi:hypothetical protein